MHVISILVPQAFITPYVTQKGTKSSCWESSEVSCPSLHFLFLSWTHYQNYLVISGKPSSTVRLFQIEKYCNWNNRKFQALKLIFVNNDFSCKTGFDKNSTGAASAIWLSLTRRLRGWHWNKSILSQDILAYHGNKYFSTASVPQKQFVLPVSWSEGSQVRLSLCLEALKPLAVILAQSIFNLCLASVLVSPEFPSS